MADQKQQQQQQKPIHHSLMESIVTPFLKLHDTYGSFREKYELRCPGPFENLHREIKNTLPTLHTFEGAKFDIASMMSQQFQVSHSLTWGSSQAPPGYQFSAGYQGSKFLMHGQVDQDGGLQARANYFWPSPSVQPEAFAPQQPPPPAPDSKEPPPAPIPPPSQRPSSATKFQSQISPKMGQSLVQFEHDHVGDSLSWNIKAINPNPFELASPRGKGGRTLAGNVPVTTTGIFSAGYLQSITSSTSVGAEVVFQRVRPGEEELGYTFAARWAPPPSPLALPTNLPAGFPSPYMPINPKDPNQVLTATYSPSQGILHSSYWRRINQRLEVAAEVQMLLTGAQAAPSSASGGRSLEASGGAFEFGRREGIATVGFKMDTVFATIRGAFDSMGKVTAVLEERMSPGLSFTISGELDYGKGQGGAGKVGVGFTLEA